MGLLNNLLTANNLQQQLGANQLNNLWNNNLLAQQNPLLAQQNPLLAGLGGPFSGLNNLGLN